MSLLPTAHSKIGASSMHRWANCPGSVRLSKDIPSSTSAYAEEGTLAHDIAAEKLTAWVKGKKFDAKSFRNNPLFEEEMLDHVDIYVDHVKSVAGASLRNKVVLIEQRFDLSSVHPGLFGTGDATVYDKATKHLSVIDLKYGQGVLVNPYKNPQLMYYGLGALVQTNLPCDTVDLTIVQPRAYHPDGPVRTFSLSAMDLIEFSADLVDFAKATEDPNAPLKAGSHCHFCPAKGLCPELEKQSLIAAKEEFTDIQSYDPVKLSNNLKLIPQIEAWIKGVREFAYEEAQRGNPPPGFKLVAKRANRSWLSEDKTVDVLTKEYGYEKDLIFNEPKLKSPAQVEKVVGKKIIEKLVSSVSSGEALVDASDKRPAVVKLTAQDSFSDIPD